ncbi:MAG: hypothetical protein U0R44_00295 [Candidatus Micrarchaeia archaeon]
MVQSFRSVFSFSFSPEEMAPLMNLQRIARDDFVLRYFSLQSILSESLMRRQQNEEQASVMARAASVSSARETESKDTRADRSEKQLERSYTITYYNPELQKAEVLEAKTDIRIRDVPTQKVEESVAERSVYPIYQYIGTPLIRTEVLPWKLQEILSEREYGTPPPPPTGAGVTPVKVVEQKESEIKELSRRDESIKAAITEAIIRKEKSELRIGEELLVMEDAIASLRAGEEMDKIIERLPPLSRARYLLVLRKKNLGRQAIINLLLKDASFLKFVKKKLELFTLDDLVGMFKLLRNMQKKE